VSWTFWAVTLLAAGGEQVPAVPNPGPAAPPELGERVNTFLAWLKWGGLVAGVIGLIICGIMMAVGRRNRHALSADGAAGIPWTLAGVSLVVTAAAIVSQFV